MDLNLFRQDIKEIYSVWRILLKKKIWANFQRIIELFTQKIVTKLSKIWLWDPGSGKNLFWIPDPGVKKALDPRSATLDIFTPSISAKPQQRPKTADFRLF
jgi:hypothetical protein